mgnify:CR=1 FL=1
MVAKANAVIGLVQMIGTITSVLALIIIGIKYMVGSVEEKAEYKKTMKPYLIGAVMVFSITNIIFIIEKLVS